MLYDVVEASGQSGAADTKAAVQSSQGRVAVVKRQQVNGAQPARTRPQTKRQKMFFHLGEN